MKFKLVETLDEKFGTKLGKQRHYYDHGLNEYPGLTEDEYEKVAEMLAEMPVDNNKILGYETSKKPSGDYRPRYIKYNVKTNDFVVYSWDDGYTAPSIVSLHKRKLSDYCADKEKNYAGEIPPWL